METILIQNFKAIKNTAKREINVANLTILMGEQATGKSTVAKLVYFFKKLPEHLLDEILGNVNLNTQSFEENIIKRTRTLFQHLFGHSKYLNDFSINYKYKNNLSLEITNKKSETLINIVWSDDNFVENLKNSILSIHEQLLLLKDKYDDIARRERQRLVGRITQKINTAFRNDQLSLYIPSSRNVVVGLEDYIFEIFSKLDKHSTSERIFYKSENEYILLNFINHVRVLKNRFKAGGFQQILDEEGSNLSTLNEAISQIEKILGARYQYDQSQEKLFYQMNDSESYVFLENSSSGQQEAIRIIQDIFLELLEGEPVFRVYEEPESHLSPVGQLGIVQLIAMLANRNPDNQIIIPTHTSYILREVTNMMTAGKVVKEHPDLEEEVGQILKPYYWLDFKSVSAYELTRDGEIIDAKDAEYDMIDGELFDRVTNDISDQFDKLLKLQYTE